ncbi:LacI family DNA-binding transcriptional regulator [Microbacterium sp. QXD-8]|uniref:LacI family DNA-binding transcriptional regulator n=1 Tax=Microbacterium psychrotolerans TaxID=3068321 RepID=A0ABU0YW67_9MICO|nr:LacI family DNA-binding transcriptional regulator [Microbacterium sp. QXD-8]MDQ7876547.1 LacI family DNA-binding transcriptional regulator [Microbacterium sp. QXD-8]
MTGMTGGNQSDRRSTLVDVARLAGVSVGTASNYLNHPERVAASTRASVAEAVRLLDFVPNGQARALRGQSRTIGMIVSDLGNSFFVEMTRGAEEAASAAGYALLVASSVGSEEKQRQLLQVFDEARFAGVLLAPFEATADYREPAGLRAPCVVLNASRPGHYGSCVVSDDELGGYIAARHMIDRGRVRLHFVAGPLRLAPIAQRLHGARRAVAEASGVRLSVEHVAFTDHLIEGEAVAAGILAQPREQRPDAILSTSDILALAIIHAVQGILKVPEELAVIGYDNNAAARDATISVSTVAQASSEMGASAFGLLLEELSGQSRQGQLISLPPQLVVRASSAAPRKESHHRRSD